MDVKNVIKGLQVVVTVLSAVATLTKTAAGLVSGAAEVLQS